MTSTFSKPLLEMLLLAILLEGTIKILTFYGTVLFFIIFLGISIINSALMGKDLVSLIRLMISKNKY